MSLVSTPETTTEQQRETIGAVGGAGISKSVDGMLDGKNQARVEAATQSKAPALGEEEKAANKAPVVVLTKEEEPSAEASGRPQTTKGRSWGKGWFQTSRAKGDINDPEEEAVDTVATSEPETAKENPTDEQALAEATNEESVLVLAKEESAAETSERPQTTKARSWGKGWFQTKTTKEENNDPEEEVVDAVATAGSETSKGTTTDEREVQETTDKEPVVGLMKEEEQATETSERPQTKKARSWGKGWFQTSAAKDEHDPVEEVVGAVAVAAAGSEGTKDKQAVEGATDNEPAIVLTKEEPAAETSERPQTTKARSWSKGWFYTSATKQENSDPAVEGIDAVATSGSENTNGTTTDEQVVEEATEKEPVAGLTKEEEPATETSERPQTKKAQSWGKGWFQTRATKDENDPAEEVVGAVTVAAAPSESTKDKQAVEGATDKEPVIMTKEEEPSIEEGLRSTEASGLGKVWLLTKESMKKEEVEIKKDPVSTKGEPIIQEETTPASIKKEEPITTTAKQEPILKKETTTLVPKKVTDKEPPSGLYSSSTGGSSDEVWC